MLFRTEVHRFSARRVVRWFIVVVLGIIALGMITTAAHSKFHTAQFTGTTCTPNGCTDFVRGQRVDDRYNLERSLADSLSGSGVGFVLVSVIFGATFIGADYAGGALTGQLVFEPRRRYVFGTKAFAVALMTGVITLGLLLVVTGGLTLVAATRGVVGHLDGSWYAHRLGDIARISGACAVAAALAFAFTSVVRRTTAAVVGFLALLFIVEPVLIHAWHGFRGRTPAYALLSTTVNRFSTHDNSGFAGFHSLPRSALVLAIWAVALLVVCGSLFARREVR